MVFLDIDRSSLVCALSAHVLLGAGFGLIIFFCVFFFFFFFFFQLLLTLPTISLFSLSATNSSEFSVDCKTSHAFLLQSFRVPFTVRNSKTGPGSTFVFFILLDWIGLDWMSVCTVRHTVLECLTLELLHARVDNKTDQAK